MVIYFGIDDDGYLTGWGSTRSSENDIELKLDEDHEFFKTDMHAWKYQDNELVFDEEKKQKLVKEREREESKPNVSKRNELAIMELAGMLASLSPQTRMAMQSTDDSGGDKMIALLYATNIIEGWITFDEVGHIWVEDVKRILKSEGREDLIK